MVKTTLNSSASSLEEHFKTQKNHNFHHYYNIVCFDPMAFPKLQARYSATSNI